MTRRRSGSGLRENLAQFSLLVAVNAFVGAMVGLERSTLPLIGREDFGLASSAAVLSFIVAFGLAKAFTNLGAGALAERVGRRRLLIARLGARAAGAAADRARAELGLDRRRQRPARRQPGPRLVDDRRDEDRPRRARGAAASRSGSTRRPATAASRSPPALSGWLAAEFAARDVLVVARRRDRASSALAAVGAVRPRHRRARRARAGRAITPAPTSAPPRLREAFADATYREPALRSCSQAGLVNNLNDALAWGLVPLFLAAHGAGVGADRARRRRSTRPSGASAQIGTGHWSDRVGRKPLIVAGMLLQAAALALLAARDGAVALAAAAAAVCSGSGPRSSTRR